MNNQLYRGGWIATTDLLVLGGGPEDLHATIARWTAHVVGPLEVRCDDTWQVSVAQHGNTRVLLLGIAMNVERPDLDQDDCVAAVARELDVSWERFLEAIDRLGGAHVIFTWSGGKLRLLQDATGMEAVCYDASADSALLASHPALIAELRGHEPSDWGRAWLSHPSVNAGGTYFPGLRTLFDDVRILTPNTSMDLASGSVERFFPRAPIGTIEVAEIVERAAPLLRGQCRWLTDRHDCLFSLTGGLDSRLSLAASRAVSDKARYYTHILGRTPVHHADAEVASQIAARTGIAHEVWVLGTRGPVDGDFLEAWQRTHRGASSDGNFQAFTAQHWPAGALHVRSNVLETIRGFYLKNRANQPDRFTAASLARVFRRQVATDFEPYFAEFIATTAFTRERKFDMHWSDLFYWEHRMGAWHSGLVRGMKAVHGTYVLFNSRRILTLLLARSVEDRTAGVVVYALLKRFWPELLDLPIYSGSRFIEPGASGS